MDNPTKEKVIVAADHAGFELKQTIKGFLEKKGYEVLDVGAHELVQEDDYPVYMSAAALKVAEDISGHTRAILFGGSGQGEATVANRFPGVRASVWYGQPKGGDADMIGLVRKHNDSNVLSIGARFVTMEEAASAIEAWLATPFSGEEKHARRNAQIDSIE